MSISNNPFLQNLISLSYYFGNFIPGSFKYLNQENEEVNNSVCFYDYYFRFCFGTGPEKVDDDKSQFRICKLQ